MVFGQILHSTESTNHGRETGSAAKGEKKGIFNNFPCSIKPGIIAIDGSWEQGVLLRDGLDQWRPLSDIKVQLLLTRSHPAPNPSLLLNILKTIFVPCRSHPISVVNRFLSREESALPGEQKTRPFVFYYPKPALSRNQFPFLSVLERNKPTATFLCGQSLAPLPSPCPGVINGRDNVAWVMSRTDTTLERKAFCFLPWHVKDKTKQEPTDQPSTLLECLLLPLQEGAGVWPAVAAIPTPASSQGPHIPVRCSRPGAQPTLPRRSAVSEHAPLPPLPSLPPGLVSRLPGRAQLPEDKTFRDQGGFQGPVNLRTFILKG